MDKKHFSKEFKKEAEKSHVYDDMLVEERNVTHSSENGREHARSFVIMLYKAISYAKIVCPTRYDEAMEQYVNVAAKQSSKVRFARGGILKNTR